MQRKIIEINEEKCDGCGRCANACHEGAIAIVNGKAKLMRDDYCDGLGDCLPVCPQNAIKFIIREAASYNEQAVLENKRLKSQEKGHSCLGKMSMKLEVPVIPMGNDEKISSKSFLSQWPCQIKLAPLKAPYYEGASLLIASDCTAYAYGAFHSKFMKGKITLIGCPKLDSADYSLKLCEILKNNSISDVSVVRMEVPCCGGLETAVKNAVKNCGRYIPLKITTISLKGEIL